MLRCSVFLFSLLVAGSVCAADQTPPNIVFIMLDDLGYFNLTCYGGKSIQGETFRTAHLDRLASEGVRFTNCHSRAMCAPTRRVLMTGKGLYTPGIRQTPPLEMPFVPRILKDVGYTTGISGKWMLGTLNPRKRGFDEAFIWAGHYDYWQPKIMVFGSDGYMKELNQPEEVELDTTCFQVPVGGGPGRADVMDGRFGPDLINRFACDFIERHAEGPFFLYYPMKLIHAPRPRIPGSQRDGSDSQSIEYADKLIQKVLDTIDQAGIAENTLVMVTSDNGFSWQHQVEAQEGVELFPGSKGSALEGSTRVPLIARWIGKTQVGSTCDGLVDFTDMLPTFVELAGAELPPGETWAGRSFLPQLLGGDGPHREWIYIHHGGHPNPLEKEQGEFYTRGDMMRYVRGVRYKLYGDGRFYDMDRDIWEKRNIPLGQGSPEAEKKRGLFQSILNRHAEGVKEATHAERADVPAFEPSSRPRPIDTAHKADDLIESVGISGLSGIAGEYDGKVAMLKELGVRYGRAGWARDGEKARYNDLYRETGVRLVINLPKRYPPIAEYIRALKETYDMNLVLALETPNENVHDEASGRRMAAYQKELWRLVQADPDLKDLPVLGPSYAHPQYARYMEDLSDYCDYGNLHSYPTVALHPAGGRLETWIEMASEGAYADVPFWATEVGYQTGANGVGVPEGVQAKYVPRLILDYFLKDETEKMFYFNLTGTTHEEKTDWGLCRADHSRKPAFFAFKNLMELFRDQGAAMTPYTPIPLDYTIHGNMEDVTQALFQKSDGTYLLCFWLSKRSWSKPDDEILVHDDRPLRIDFGSEWKQTEVYRPAPAPIGNGLTPILWEKDNDTLTLNVNDQVTVVRLTPASAAPSR